MQNGDEASPSIILTSQSLQVKMLITFEPCGIIGSNLYTTVFKHCLAAGMQNIDEASPSINLAGRALLVKMLITLKPHGIFGSNFVY